MKKYIIFLVVISFWACKPSQQIVLPSINHTSTNIDHGLKKDSIYIYKHDSIRITQKGDTIYMSSWNTEYRDRWHTKTDSIIKTDTLKIVQPVISEVEKKLTWLQSGELLLGKLFVGFLIILLIYAIIKFFPVWSKIFIK